MGLPLLPPTPFLRLRIALLAALLAVGLGLSIERLAGGQVSVQPPANRDLVLVPGGRNAAFDEQTLRLIASRADVIAIRSELAGSQGGKSYGEIVRRLKELNPNLTVLMYAHSVTFPDNANIEASILRPIYEAHPEWVLDYRSNNRTYAGDVRNPQFRAAVLNATAEMLGRVGADGVFFDNSKLSPRQLLPERSKDPQFVTDYKEGMRSFFREARQRLQPKPVYFNGCRRCPSIPTSPWASSAEASGSTRAIGPTTYGSAITTPPT